MAAERKVVIVTTLGPLSQYTVPDSTPDRWRALTLKSAQVHRGVHVHNMRILKQHGVRIAIGSDSGERLVVDDVFGLASLGVFSNLEILKMWCETTAQAIFPQRKIGFLRDGFEASLLVLAGNPIEDLEHVRRIVLGFKQGRPLDLGPAPPAGASQHGQ